MTAQLIDPEGVVRRQWRTDSPELALTANRNLSPGWSVVLVGAEK